MAARQRDMEVQCREEGEGVVVSSPAVGVYRDAPRVGEVLVGGSRAGRLTRLGRTVDLIMPPGAGGRVAARALRHRAAPVQYGEVLLRLEAIEAEGWATDEPDHRTGHDLPQGTLAITSPTHGVFYRRPGPGEPPYVEAGDLVEEGTTVGLVEVMKCFSSIAYRGEGFPARAEVVEIRAEDGDEVRSDQVLLVMKPA